MKRLLVLCAMLLPAMQPASGDAAPAPVPPVAAKVPHSTTVHGVTWEDDYFWLRKLTDPKVRAYFEAENAYTAAVLAPMKPLSEKLAAEMKARVIEKDVSVPVKKGPWYYYTRDLPGKEHFLVCRSPEPEGEETVVLDLNERAGKSDAYTFGKGAVSPDANLYAWKENHDGTDRYVIRVKDLRTGTLLPDTIPGSAFDTPPVWAADNLTIFYTEADETQRSFRVKRHTLGTAPETDVVVLEEKDPRFQLEMWKTKSGRHLILSSENNDTTETSTVPLDQPHAKPVVFAPRREGIRYGITDCQDDWYIISNEGAINGRVFRTKLTQPRREHWREVIPHDEDVTFARLDGFDAHVVLTARKGGVPGMYILDAKTAKARWVEAPEPGAMLDLKDTPDPSSSFQQITYESFLKPYVVANVDLATGAITTVKQKASPPGYDATKYRVERLHATAPDGERIGIWMVVPKAHAKDGRTPILLSGYGGYGIPNDPYFDIALFSLLDRGMGYAIAQVRGGGELGRRWYEAGKLTHRQQTFTDFIACAEHLIKEGHTTADKLCAYGGSAGGLLIGAVLNQRPELFRAVIADVPFVDVVNTMLDPTIPLTTAEYSEFGNPSTEKDAFLRLRSFSPYDNVKAQAYPALFVQTGWNDSRVCCWEPAKWVARLRATKKDANLLVLRTEMDTGHSGSTGRFAYLDQTAQQYAFLLHELGVGE